MLHVVRFAVNGAASRISALLLGTVLLGGCSLKSASHDAHLSLVLPNPGSHAVRLGLNNLSGGTTGAPAAWNAPGFICYGVNVTGPGIADSSLNPKASPDLTALIAGTSSCAYRGIVSNGFTFTSATGEVAIDLQVPPGADRVIQLIGITNANYCATNFLEQGGNSSPGAYEIGRVRTDLVGDSTVSIPITYVASETKRVDCGNGSAATIGPVVAITTPALGSYLNSASGPTLSLAGSCTETNQPVVISGTPGITSVSANCSAGSWTASIPLSPIPDGPISITVNHASTAGVSATPFTASYTKDTVPPGIASALAWSNTSPSTVAGQTATWTRATPFTDVAKQVIQFYSGAGCSSPVGTAITLPGTASTQSFTAPADGTYYYNVVSIDAAGNSSGPSPCSWGMIVDTTPPSAATTLGWSQISPTNVPNLTASWTKSGSTDLANQQIQFYTDALCSVLSGAPINVVSTSNTYPFTAPSDGTFYYNVISLDAAGNSTVSTCSAPMLVDRVAPTLAITSPAAGTFVSSANVASFIISGTCSENGQNVVISGSVAGTTVCTANTWSTALNFGAVADGPVNVIASHTDLAGNLTTLTIPYMKDTTPPVLASMTITNPSPSFIHILTLNPGAITGTYFDYCILENSTVVGGCTFIVGTLPPTFSVLQTSGPKVLSIWLRDAAGNISARVDTNSITYDNSCDLMLATGNGAAGSPYLISTPTQLQSCLPMMDSPSANFRIQAPFPLTSITAPIPQLLGTLDGNSLTLTGLNISSPLNNVGLFASVNGGTVQNLTISGVALNCAAANQTNCGAIAGQATGAAKFINNHVTSTTSVSINAFFNAGGVVGYANGNVSFAMNSVDLLSMSVATGGARIGGIVGAYHKGAAAPGDDFYRNRVTGTGVVTCGNDMGGLVGAVAIDTLATTLSLRENAVKLAMNCAGGVGLQRIGGLVGSLNFGSSGVSVGISDSNVVGNLTFGSSPVFIGGVVGEVITGAFTGNTVGISSAIIRGTVSSTGVVGAALGGSDATSPGASYILNSIYWLSQTNMPSITSGSFYPAAPTATSSGGLASATALQTPGNLVGGNFPNASVWTLSLGIYPKLAFETTIL